MDEWHMEKWFVVCKSERTLCLSRTKKTKKKENIWLLTMYSEAGATHWKGKKNQFKRLWFFPPPVFVELSNYWAKKKSLEYIEIGIKTYFFLENSKYLRQKWFFFSALHSLCFTNEIQDVDIWYICMIDGA